MKKLKLLLAFCALLIGWSIASAQTAPTASTPSVGNTYYLYNPTTKLFMTTNVELPFVRPTGSAWKLEAAAGHDGWITLRLKDNETEGCGYFWGKWWANNPAQNSTDYADERVFKLVNTSGENYKLQSYAWGDTEAYIYINNGNSGDRSFRLACNSQDQGGLDAGYLTWQFISEADYAAYMTKDYTANIQNNDFLNGTNNWTLTGGGNKQALGNTAIEHWQEKAAEGDFDYYQNVVVPAGKYVLRAAMFNSTNGEAGANFDAAGQCGVYGTSNGVTMNANVSVDGTAYNIYTTEELLVPDGNLRLGFKNSATMTARWFGVDWIQLACIEYCLSAVAVSLPDGGAMAADTWYYFDVPTAADNYLATATTLGDIVCTDDGNALISAATGSITLTAANNNFAAKRYYVKSSSANNLEIGVASYSYSISDASADVSYIQEGNTVTVSYTTSSNEPGATLKQDYSGVTFGGNAISVTPTASGFTFTVPTVTANTDYTLSIPAGAIKYNEENKNAAQNITLKTPAVFDGVYYMYNTYTRNYLSRGGNYATQAILDNYGMAVIVKTDANNATTVQYFDIARFLGDDGFCYADCNGGRIRTYNIASVDGGYKFLNTNNSKYLAVYENQAVGDAVEGDNLVGTSNVWSLESTTSHVANYTVNADAQVATATANITALSSITTKAALEAELASNYCKTSIAITGSKAEKYQVYATNANPSVEATYYSETVSGLTPGLYKLSVDAFQRAGSNGNVAAADGARGLIYLYAGTAKTQLKSIMDASATSAYSNDFEYDGKHYPNNEASAYTALENCDYSNDVYVYVSADEDSETGSLEIGIKNPNYPGANNGCWAVYNNWTLTYYEAKATAAEKTALAAAISAAEANTLGFEDGEYAPYNNVAAINALTAAKAIDPETASGAAVVAATTALNNATWTANVVEVNAVYWKTDYTAGDKAADNYVHPIGWTNTGYNTRIMCAANDAAENAAMTTIGTAVFSKFNTTYGETAGYTMPLKAGKIYKITFKYCGWGNNPTTNVVLTDPESNTITLAPGFRPATNDGNKNAEHWYDYTGYFVSTTAGNYVLAMNKVESGQQQIAWANMQIVSASELEFADGSVPTYAPGTYPSVKISRSLTAGKWATAVYPFAVSGVDNIAVLNSYNSSTGELGFSSAAASTANVPFFMMSNTDKSEITLSDVAVAATVANPVATKSEASLKGAYTATEITNAEKNYVLSNNEIFSVGTAGATINPYRAYIQLTEGGSTPARALRFVVDGQITGVDNVAAAEASAEVKDGKYIENGKVVIVKNGKKFNANGQQVK